MEDKEIQIKAAKRRAMVVTYIFVSVIIYVMAIYFGAKSVGGNDPILLIVVFGLPVIQLFSPMAALWIYQIDYTRWIDGKEQRE